MNGFIPQTERLVYIHYLAYNHNSGCFSSKEEETSPELSPQHSRLARFVSRDAFTIASAYRSSLGTFYTCAPAYKARRMLFFEGFYAVRLGQISSPGGDAEVIGRNFRICEDLRGFFEVVTLWISQFVLYRDVVG